MKVRLVEGDPSYLDSYLLWKKFSRSGGGVQRLFESVKYSFPQPFYKLTSALKVDICPFCEGWGEINDPNHGRAYCLCAVLSWSKDIELEASGFRSYLRDERLNKLIVDRGLPIQRQMMSDALTEIEDWLEWPNKWLVLVGPNGTGKTTALASIQNEFPGISMYVTAYDFEQRMYTGLEDGTFNQYLEILGRVPILLFDDWGAEYGKPLVHTKAAGVIDQRDRIWQDLLTVVATNLPESDFKSYNMRMGSRLRDRDKLTLLRMLAPDHRVPEV